MNSPLRRTAIRLAGLAALAIAPAFAAKPPPAPDTPRLRQTADALLAEADVIDRAPLRQAVRERAADLLRQIGMADPGPGGAQALLQAGELYLGLGGDAALAEALECATLVELHPANARLAPDAALLKVRLFRQQKEWGRAVRHALDCAQRHPQHTNAPAALFAAARIFEEHIRNPAEAEQYYGAILANYPGSPQAPEALAARAGMRAKARQYPEAVADYLAVVDSYPDSPGADQALYEAIVLCDSRLRDFPRAHELAVRFRTLFPHSALLKKAETVETRTLKYVRDAAR